MRLRRTWGEVGLCLTGVHGKVRSDKPCVLAWTGDWLIIWAVPGGVVGKVLVQSAGILYGRM